MAPTLNEDVKHINLPNIRNKTQSNFQQNMGIPNTTYTFERSLNQNSAEFTIEKNS